MVLTKQRSSRDPDAFPTIQLFLLAIVRLAEPIALTSIFPYAWALVKRFKIGQEQDASFYAGLLISSFSLCEAAMGMWWGGLSDRIGRKPVLLIGCTGTMLSMVVVGFADSIWIALLGRAVGGLLNGNIGVIQTMVAELVTNPDHEPRAYAVMPFVWYIGTVIGPTVGGTFADPHQTFPRLFPAGSLFYRFPYLLPNLICAGLLLTSVLLGYFLLEETHPDLNPDLHRASAHRRRAVCDGQGGGDGGDGDAESCRDSDSPPRVTEETPLHGTSDAIKMPAVDLRSETYGTFRSRDETVADVVTTEKQSTKMASLRSLDQRILVLILALAIFTYHSMTFDHLLPIFLEDDRASPVSGLASSIRAGLLAPTRGLGLSLRAVGMIMAVNGLIALFIQAVVFPLAAQAIGVFRLYMVVTILHPAVYLLMPLLVHVPGSMLYPAIYLCLGIRNILSIIVYPLLLILIKEATPSANALGLVNGLAASAGAACRMMAPPVAGYLYTAGSRIEFTALAWWGSALVAVVGSFQCFWVQRPRCYYVVEDEDEDCTTTGSENRE